MSFTFLGSHVFKHKSLGGKFLTRILEFLIQLNKLMQKNPVDDTWPFMFLNNILSLKQIH